MKLSIRISRFKIFRSGLVLLTLYALSVNAQITWDGSESTDWGTAGNWDSNSIPGSTDNVIIPATSESNYNAPTIATDAVYEVNNLTVAESGRLEIGGESATLIVNGNTDNGGLVRANTNSSLVLFGSYSGTGTFANSRSVYGNSNYSIYAVPFTDGNVGLFNGVYAYQWNNDSGAFDALDYSVSTTPGEGYFVSMPGFSEDVFTLGFGGSPVGADVDVPITMGESDDYNLVGNPYTAAISVADFLSNSTNASLTTGVIYLWDDGGMNSGSSRGGDFITANSAGAVGTNALSDGVAGVKGTEVYDGYITSMQGFYIEAKADGNLEFTQDMQVAGNNNDTNFYRKLNSSDLTKVKLALASESYESETLIAFDPLATTDIDYALDAKKKLANSAVSFYSLNDNVEFAIQALNLSSLDEEVSIPLGYEVENTGDYLIKTKRLQGFDEDLSVWLVDKENNTFYNLQENVDISINLSSKSSESRFALQILSKRVLGEKELSSELTLVKANERGLTISYAKQEQYVTIYDMNGRVHFSKAVFDDRQPVSLDVRLSRHQVYVLKVGNESLKFSIK